MAQVPMRMAQPGLVPPHQQRPPMMVSMTQPPPASMQGLASMAPMMGPGGGMAVMSQGMNHPDSGHDHHSMNGPYHHPHHHHHPHHGSTPRPQTHHPGPPQIHPNGHQPSHSAPQYTHHGPPVGGPHSVHHSNPHNSSHPAQHMSNNGNSSHGVSQQHLHMNQSSHSMSHHSAQHNMTNISPTTMNSHHQQQQQQQQQQHNLQQHHHHPQQQIQQHNPPQSQQTPPHHSETIHSSSQQHTPQSSRENISSSGGAGIIILNSSNSSNNSTRSGGSNFSKNPVSSQNNSSNNSNVNGMTNSGNPIILDNNAEHTGSTREKTPMCLINELARYNKIQHQYCLTDEKGPAHKKIFTVTLHLGENEEEYSASGASIKKAQHSAAEVALVKTKFKHPPPKTQRQSKQTKLTPTVELNAVAMKRGEVASYTFMETGRPSNAYNGPPNFRTLYSQKYYGRPPVYPMFFVNLKVGSKEFTGEGATAQQAKHNAASKALKIIKALPMPDISTTAHPPPPQADLSELDPNADLKSPISLVHEIALKRNLTVSFEVVRESGPPHMRTFVTTCIVGDIRCQGEGTGKKISKKRSAELMLEQLRKLPPQTPNNNLSRMKRKPTTKKKSRNLIKVGQEEQKAAPSYGHGINPISRLIQIQQAKKEKEPVYILLAERGVPRRREFVMQVTVGSSCAQGSGPNKKLAKRAAAESMLQLLGYSQPQPQPGKPAIKIDGSHSEADKARKQVTFSEESPDPSQVLNNNMCQTLAQGNSIPTGSGRQLVPGLIMMPDSNSALHGYQQMQQPGMNMSHMNQIAKELLESGNSPTAKALSKKQSNTSSQNECQQISQQQTNVSSTSPQSMQHTLRHQPMMQSSEQMMQQPQVVQQSHLQSLPNSMQQLNNSNANNSAPSRNGLTISGNTAGQAIRPKEQLMYLANILNLQVQFTDFPKGIKSDYLSLVSLSTVPPHVSHGAGSTIEASHDQACLTALKALAEMGLDSVASANRDNSSKNN